MFNKKIHKLTIGDIKIDIIQKPIKNAHLRVYPPDGRVQISVPRRMGLNTIRAFIISKLDWIEKHQRRIRNQASQARLEYISGEIHYYNGKRYILKIIEMKAIPKVILTHSAIELYVRPDTDTQKKKALLDKWYRLSLKATIPYLIEKWEAIMKVSVADFGVKRMKTRWGTCNCKAKRIWLNLELARKSMDCLEYVVIHEMVHLLENRHNKRFKSLMTQFLPNWQRYKKELKNITQN